MKNLIALLLLAPLLGGCFGTVRAGGNYAVTESYAQPAYGPAPAYGTPAYGAPLPGQQIYYRQPGYRQPPTAYDYTAVRRRTITADPRYLPPTAYRCIVATGQPANPGNGYCNRVIAR